MSLKQYNNFGKTKVALQLIFLYIWYLKQTVNCYESDVRSVTNRNTNIQINNWLWS